MDLFVVTYRNRLYSWLGNFEELRNIKIDTTITI